MPSASCGWRRVWSVSARSAVRAELRRAGSAGPSDVSRSEGWRGVAEPGCHSTIAAVDQVALRVVLRRTRSRPAAPALPPSVDTNTSVFVWLVGPELVDELEQRRGGRGARRRARAARPSRAAPSPRRSGPSRPGSVRITLRSSTSLPSKLPGEALLGDLAVASTCPNRFSTMSPIARVALAAGGPVGRRVDDLARDPGRRAARRTRPAPRPSAADAGGACSANSSTTTAATSAGEACTVDAEVDHGAESANYPLSTLDRARAANTGSARILLVDDEQSVQTLLTYPLRKEGYEVVAAHDGREALDRFAEQRFDLVVLDIMLPKLDGIEVCRRLRSRSQVPIIMLTAKDDEIDKVLGLEMGADDYITKPFSVREFRSRVRAALRRAEMLGGRPGGEEPIAAGDLEDRLRAPRRHRARTSRSGSPTSSSRSSPRLPARRAGCTPARCCSSRSGATRPTATRARRRPHPPPAREARARPALARVPVHGARRRLPLPRQTERD